MHSNSIIRYTDNCPPSYFDCEYENMLVDVWKNIPFCVQYSNYNVFLIYHNTLRSFCFFILSKIAIIILLQMNS